MNSQEAWNSIISGLAISTEDYSTVPKINREPLWFSAILNENYVIIDRAKNNIPTCKINSPRIITYPGFETVYPYYKKWRLGQVGVRMEARQRSRNTAYIFGLIERFCI